MRRKKIGIKCKKLNFMAFVFYGKKKNYKDKLVTEKSPFSPNVRRENFLM